MGMAVNQQDFWPKVDGIRYLEFLRRLHRKLQPEWYLEVGTFRGQSLAQCDCNFVAVDPRFKIDAPVISGTGRHMYFHQMTSDAFFESGFAERNGITFDFAFLDGLHHFETLLRDFIGAERLMKPDGTIALHDCCPTSVEMVGRDKTAGMWTGDVWKTVKILKAVRPDLEIEITSARPTGLAIVRNLDPESTVLTERYDDLVAEAACIPLTEAPLAAYYQDLQIVPPRKVLHAIG